MTRRTGVTLPPQRAAYGVTRRGHAVLRVMSALVTITVCSMAMALLVAVFLAWVYDWKPTW